MGQLNDQQLDSRKLRYFLQVCETGTVRGAAEVLDMDPSVVSRAIGQLEQACGTPLLERRGRGVVLTEAGELLANYLRYQNAQKQRLLDQFESIKKFERGHIDIVAGEGFVDWLMHHSLRSFMTDYPGITINLEIGSSDDIVQRIVEERAHLGLLFQPPRDERLRTHCAYPHPIQTMVREDHPLAKVGRPLTLSDLVAYAGAMLDQQFGVRQHIHAAEVSEGVRLQPLLTTTSFQAIHQFARAGMGYVLSTRMPEQHMQDARVVALPMKNPLLSQGKVQLISRHGRLLPATASELKERIVADLAQNRIGT